MVFVFGSNRAGIHGAGAARYAHAQLGAVWGVGEGLTGRCYALPTKDENIQTLPMEEIEQHFAIFIDFATANVNRFLFDLTPIGCGLAGYTKPQMLEMMLKQTIPDNVYFNRRWFQE